MSDEGEPREKSPNARTFTNLRGRTKEMSKERQQLAAACQRIFSLPEGQFVMAWLKRVTDGTVLGPDVSDGALRAHEGKRQLVHALEELASVGRPKSES